MLPTYVVRATLYSRLYPRLRLVACRRLTAAAAGLVLVFATARRFGVLVRGAEEVLEPLPGLLNVERMLAVSRSRTAT